MSADELVYNTISDNARLPGARMFWGPQPPEPPYFTYELRPASVFADNETQRLDRYTAKLYQDELDPTVVERFESAVSMLGTYIKHPDEWQDGLLVTRYDFTLTKKEAD